MRAARSLATGTLVVASTLTAQRPERAADRVAGIPHLDLAEFAAGRPAGDLTELEREWSEAEARALLDDDDPRVRAVALLVFHAHAGRRALPALFELIGDHGAAPRLRSPMLGAIPDEDPYRYRAVTVGELALGIVGSYLPHQLTEPHLDGSRIVDERVVRRAYADYLRTRHGRDHCLIWIRAEFARASGGTNPTPAECVPRIRAVRARLDSIPAPARDWFLLSLGTDWGLNGREHLATEVELVPAARCDELVELAALHAEHRGGGLGGGNHGITTADWYLTAAALQPDRADEHLGSGLASIPDDLPVYRAERARLVR